MNRDQIARHPEAEELALFLRGDLPSFRGWQVNNHVHHCALCEGEVEQFQAARAELKRQAEIEALTGFEASTNWSRIEREMTGNINVGVAASRAIGNIGRRRLHGWRGAALAGTLAAVFIGGWLLNVPREDTNRVLSVLHSAWYGPRVTAGFILQTTSHGVSVRSQGASLTVLHPASANVTASFTGSSSVAVRYVDDETGQVTITNVYGE